MFSIFRWLRVWRSLSRIGYTVSFWRYFTMSVTVEKLTEEFQSFLTLDAAAKSKAATRDDAVANHATIADQQNAMVAAAQAEADTQIANSQVVVDEATADATAAAALSEAQKFYLGGLLGLTPPTSDPTP